MSKIYQFHWQARNKFQQKQRGKLLAENHLEVEKYLLNKGFQQICIQRNFHFNQQIKQEEITQFIQQLGQLVQAHIPLKQALLMLVSQCQQIKLFLWIRQIITLLEAGYAFSDSLQKINQYLSSQEIMLIKIGETSGQLAIILSNLAQSRQKAEKLQKKFKKIMFYPVIVLVLSLGLSLFLLLAIVPNFIELYRNKQQTLPLITEILFSLSNWLQESFYFIIFSFIFIFFLFFWLRKYQWIMKVKIILLSHLPLFHSLFRYTRIIFFSQNLTLMLSAHIRLDKALSSFLSEKPQDLLLHKEIQQILQSLQQGHSFSESLNPMTFSEEMCQMVAVGEKSGQLAKMLSYITQRYQQKLDEQIDLLSQLLEPILMIIIGILVGSILIGLYLPIFDMGAMIE